MAYNLLMGTLNSTHSLTHHWSHSLKLIPCKRCNAPAFYRPKLCVSARSLLSPVYVCLFICPSVRPSVTLVYCIHTAEDIVKLLSWPGSPVILVFFLIRSADTQFQGEPFIGVQNTFEIFDRNHHLSRKRNEIGPWLLWNVIRKSGGGSIGVGFNDLEWPVTRVSRSLYS